MGALTVYLQREFASRCPPGWVCDIECRLLPPELERVMGYSPRADVVLTRSDRQRRLWIEFEVSRADPVANHAKFATAHLFYPQAPGDAFLAMVSSHVARGRRNLAANTVQLMRAVGMRAYQTVLLPNLTPDEVKWLNHLSQGSIAAETLPIENELERALIVSEVLITMADCEIHYAGELTDVVLNLRRWNVDIATPEGQSYWGRRTITYFVFDPACDSFAPSKFCAYVAVPEVGSAIASSAGQGRRSEMTIPVYASIDQQLAIFDGARARIHLTQRLGMKAVSAAEYPELQSAFQDWCRTHEESILVDGRHGGPTFLVPPSWFR